MEAKGGRKRDLRYCVEANKKYSLHPFFVLEEVSIRTGFIYIAGPKENVKKRCGRGRERSRYSFLSSDVFYIFSFSFTITFSASSSEYSDIIELSAKQDNS